MFKKIITITLLLSPFMINAQVKKIFSGNPVITSIYTADPSVRVFNDTLYIYPSHDNDNAKWWDMKDYHVFSTADMVSYKDNGLAFAPLKETTWAKKFAWAPDCIERNGKYYLYYPIDQDAVGVAVSDKPTGPFKDPLGKPLITRNSPGVVAPRDFIDPCVFIDDDGQAYLFVGQNTLCCVKLNEDMISYSGQVSIIDVQDFFEGAWIHKYKGKYYMSYSNGLANKTRDEIVYAVSDNILGPYEYKGIILEAVNSGTNHHSIVEYKGNWYIFYHNADLAINRIPENDPERKYIQWRRSVCVDRLYYNSDGTIKTVTQTKQGVEKL